MSDFPTMQDRSRTIIASSDLSAGSGHLMAAWGNGGSSAIWPVANRAIFVPILIHQPYIVQSMFTLNGATAAGNTDVGIYTEGGVLLVSSGSTAQAGTTVAQSFNVTDTLLLPGVYYMACAKNDIVGTIFNIGVDVVLNRAMGVLSQSTAFALPNPATFAAAQDTHVPVFGIVGKTVL